MDEGHVAIDWSYSPEGFTIAWREHGGPRVRKPRHRGFGSQLIEDIPGRALGGTVVHRYEPKGVVWELSIPESNLVDRARLTA